MQEGAGRPLIDGPGKAECSRGLKRRTRYVLTSPRLEEDSFTGFVKHAARRVPLTAVDRVATRKFNTQKTVWWVVGVPVLALGAVVALACAGGGCSMNFGSGSDSY